MTTCFFRGILSFVRRSGGMADAQASGACYGNIVWVQVPSPASALFNSLQIICGSVGTGRRARLRILWWVHRVGSSPIFRSNMKKVLFHSTFFFSMIRPYIPALKSLPALRQAFLMNSFCIVLPKPVCITRQLRRPAPYTVLLCAARSPADF